MKKETLKNLHSQVSVPGPSGPSCFSMYRSILTINNYHEIVEFSQIWTIFNRGCVKYRTASPTRKKCVCEEDVGCPVAFGYTRNLPECCRPLWVQQRTSAPHSTWHMPRICGSSGWLHPMATTIVSWLAWQNSGWKKLVLCDIYYNQHFTCNS